VALINLSYAFFAFEKRQHTLLVLLTTLSYVIGRFLTPVQPELIDVWISFDLLVGFTVVLGFPILLGRLKHFEIFFNNLRTIEEQKALNIYSSKMSALGEMAAGMAHEINNPLAIVSGMAFQIGMYIDRNVENKEEKIKESTIRITQTVNRISHIISSLRTFSKESDTVQRENFDIEKMIVNTLNLCNSRLEENKISLSISNHSKSKNLYSNSVAFMQILLSLINNSIYALKDSNNKWIQILIIDSEDPPASPNTTTNIKIKFTDSGPGIPESIQDKIMQPFFTTKPIGQGSGLGLSTAKGLAESLNGTLYLDKKSENTCFVLELPVPQNMDSLPNG
jgi:C4-dicarboxylate-specific signal transduction histidine kinase